MREFGSFKLKVIQGLGGLLQHVIEETVLFQKSLEAQDWCDPGKRTELSGKGVMAEA